MQESRQPRRTTLTGVVCRFDEGLTTGVFTYPDGRISIHRFVRWDDGVIRCDCHWKQHHWKEECKHEEARRERIEGEQ